MKKERSPVEDNTWHLGKSGKRYVNKCVCMCVNKMYSLWYEQDFERKTWLVTESPEVCNHIYPDWVQLVDIYIYHTKKVDIFLSRYSPVKI